MNETIIEEISWGWVDQLFEHQKCKIRTDTLNIWNPSLLKRKEHYYMSNCPTICLVNM